MIHEKSAGRTQDTALRVGTGSLSKSLDEVDALRRARRQRGAPRRGI